MTLEVADRVHETTTTEGIGTISLGGAVAGAQSFVTGIGNGNATYYVIADDVDWEVGVGTVTSGSPDTLTRTTVLGSSNGGAKVVWVAGTRNVFCSLPAAGPIRQPSYTVSQLGTLGAANYAGCTVYVTNESGGATIAYSNGTNWLRVYDNATIS